MHVCFNKLPIIDSDNGLSPHRCQTIIWTNAGILLIGPLATNFSEILIEIDTFSFKKMHLKMSSGKWRLSCLSLNVLTANMLGLDPLTSTHSCVSLPFFQLTSVGERMVAFPLEPCLAKTVLVAAEIGCLWVEPLGYLMWHSCLKYHNIYMFYRPYQLHLNGTF